MLFGLLLFLAAFTAASPPFCSVGSIKQFYPQHCGGWKLPGEYCHVLCGVDSLADPFVCLAFQYMQGCFAECKEDGSWHVPCACNTETLSKKVRGGKSDRFHSEHCFVGEVCPDIDCDKHLCVKDSVKCDFEEGFTGSCACEPLISDRYSNVKRHEDFLCEGLCLGEVCEIADICENQYVPLNNNMKPDLPVCTLDGWTWSSTGNPVEIPGKRSGKFELCGRADEHTGCPEHTKGMVEPCPLPPCEPEVCEGFQALQCTVGECVDDPRDECVLGVDTDCLGICLTPRDPCDSDPCGTNAICNVANNMAVCSCPLGYGGDPLKQCTKLTEQICFAASSIVTVLDKNNIPTDVRIDSLQIGDRVLSVDNEGNAVYEELYWETHRIPLTGSDTITTLKRLNFDGQFLDISPTHLVYATSQRLELPNDNCIHFSGDKICVYKSGQLRAADTLWIISNDNKLEPKNITHITYVQDKIRAPKLLNGNIVVNGVIASCFVDQHITEQATHMPLRAMYKLGITGGDYFLCFWAKVITPLRQFLRQLASEYPQFSQFIEMSVYLVYILTVALAVLKIVVFVLKALNVKIKQA